MRHASIFTAALLPGLLGAIPTGAMAQTTIPMAQAAGGVDVIEATVDGHQGVYMFDSGWGVSSITPNVASVIGCDPWGRITGFRATGERVDLQRCSAAALRIGPLTRHVRELSVIDLSKLMGRAGDRFAGGIGLDAFDGEVVTLSVARRSMTVESAASARKIARRATEVPIRLVRDSQGAALTADLGIPTRLGTLWLEIDTGNYGPSRIDRRAAALMGIAPEGKGRQHLDVPVVGQVRFSGAAVVGDLIMDGNLGREALMGWDVTLDLAHGRGWMMPAKPSGTAS